MKSLFDIYGCSDYPLVRLLSVEEKNIAAITHAQDLSPSLVDNGTSTLSFAITDNVEEPIVHYYDSVILKNRVYIEELDMMFVITGCEETVEGDSKTKRVECITLEAEDFNKPITIQKGIYPFWDVLKPSDSILGRVLKQVPEWSVGGVDAELAVLNYRFEDTTMEAYGFLMNDVEDAYECVFRFDTVNKKLYAYTNENSGHNTDFVFRMTDVVKDTSKSSDNTKFITAMEVTGGNGLSIATVNPLGTNTIYDYSGVYDRMSDAFRGKVIAWQAKVVGSQGAYANLLTQLNDKNAEMQVLKTQLVEIQSSKDVKHEIMALHIKNGTTSSSEYSKAQSEYSKLEGEESKKEVTIKAKQSEIDAIMGQLKPINESLQPIKNFTPEELIILSRFTYSYQHIDEKYTQTSDMGNKEIQDMAQKLYDKAKLKLAKHSGELVAIDINMSNIMLDEKYTDYVNRMRLGDNITVEVSKDKFVNSRLLVCEWNYDNPETMTIQIADGLKAVGDKYEVAEKVIKKNTIDNSIKVDMGGWIEASGNNTFLNNLQNEGLNANLQAIKSNENAEFRVDGTGALMRRHIPETNTYSPEQLWLVHNQIVITDNAFETIKMAIGKLLMADGSTWGYGISSELLVGKIIMGQKCIIQSEDTMVTIDGDGIKVENGHIFIKDKNGEAYIDGEKISLGGTVGLSTDKSYSTGNNVMIFAGADTYELREDALFRVYDDGRVVMQNAEVTGDITATSIRLEGDLVTPDGGICNEGGRDTALFWGGSSHEGREDAPFRVTHGGDLYAENAEIRGRVSCTELYLDGEYVDNILTQNNKIDAKYIDNLEVGSFKADTAKIDSCWNKNLFVEELRTNFDQWLWRSGATATEENINYTLITKEEQKMVNKIVNPKEYEYLNINGRYVYYLYIIGEEIEDWFTFTSINQRSVEWEASTYYPKHTVVTNGAEYKYITVDDMPNTIDKWSDLNDKFAILVVDDDFKVKVKQTIAENIKHSQKFDEITLSDGSRTVAPLSTWGSGTDTAGVTLRGKGFQYKEQRGLAFGTYNENNDSITALLADGVDCCLKYWDMNKKTWIPLINPWKGGAGNVVFHADKASFTEQDCIEFSVGQNALHIGYNSTTPIATGKDTSMYLNGLVILGVETSTEIPPVVELPIAPFFYDDFNNGSKWEFNGRYATIVGGTYLGSTGSDAGVYKTPILLKGKFIKVSSKTVYVMRLKEIKDGYGYAYRLTIPGYSDIEYYFYRTSFYAQSFGGKYASGQYPLYTGNASNIPYSKGDIDIVTELTTSGVTIKLMQVSSGIVFPNTGCIIPFTATTTDGNIEVTNLSIQARSTSSLIDSFSFANSGLTI